MYVAKSTYIPFVNYAWGLRLHECAKMSAHNFVESGQNDPNHPKWKQLSREREWRAETYSPPCRMTFARKLFSISVRQSLLGRIDTFFFKGKYYKEYFL